MFSIRDRLLILIISLEESKGNMLKLAIITNIILVYYILIDFNLKSSFVKEKRNQKETKKKEKKKNKKKTNKQTKQAYSTPQI